MAELAVRPEVIPLKSGTVATGNKDIRYVIERQDRRLARLDFQLNVTLGGTILTTTVGDRLEGYVKNLTVKASDTGGSRRDIFSQGSATLLHWQRLHLGKLSRHQATVVGQATAGTYLLTVPLFFMHPLAMNPVGYGMSLPLWPKDNAGVGLGDDLEVNVELAAMDTAGCRLGASATVTVNPARMIASFVELGRDGSAAAGIPYIPQALVTNDFDIASTGEQSLQIPEDGFLTSMLFEQFSNQTGTRGTALAAPLTDYYRLFYGASEVDIAIPSQCQLDDELWADSYPTDDSVLNAHNGSDVRSATVPSENIFTRNFWHRFPQAEARLLNSCPNLWKAGAKGDGFKIKPTNVAASTRLRVTSHKMLVNNPNILTGA